MELFVVDSFDYSIHLINSMKLFCVVNGDLNDMEMLRTWIEWTLPICSVPITRISGCAWVRGVRPVIGHVLSMTRYFVLDKLSYVGLNCCTIWYIASLSYRWCNVINCWIPIHLLCI